jgi:hypothetical protein
VTSVPPETSSNVHTIVISPRKAGSEERTDIDRDGMAQGDHAVQGGRRLTPPTTVRLHVFVLDSRFPRIHRREVPIEPPQP